MKTITKKSLGVISIMILFIQMISPCLMAAEIGDAYYLSRGPRAFYTLQRYDGSLTYITYEIVRYTDKQGNPQVAYCLDPNSDGVGWAQGSIEGYNVTLTDMLQDKGEVYKKIWRVCINGYPYKDPQHIGKNGVETEEDAYLATKLANYAVLRGFTLEKVRDYYRVGNKTIAGQNLEDIQRRGKKVQDAICDLVTIANDNTINPKNSNNISVNKVSKLKKDAKEGYCSQEYVVDSSMNIESYTITKLNNFPNGTIVTDMNGNTKNTFNNKDHFKVLIPTSKLTQNISGTIEMRVKCENYPIFFGTSQKQGYQNYAVCGGKFGDITKTISLDVTTNISKIQVNKIDEDTKKPISNVKFQISQNGKVVATATTDDKGVAVFPNLYPGEYTLKEIAVDESYVLDQKEIKVNVGFDEVININRTNVKKKGKIKVIKVDKDNNEIRLEGVVFDVLDEKQNIVDTIVTNSNGEAQSKDLPIDQVYTVREKTTRDEYVLTEEMQTVKLEYNKVQTLKFQNEKKKGQIKVIKVDEDFSEIRIPNVEFKIYNSKGEVVDTIITDENGEAVTKRLPIDDTYTIKETKTDRKYLLNKTEITVTLKQDEIQEHIITNEHKKGDLVVYKVDKDNNKVNLGGIEFDLFSEEFNKVIGKYVTNADGEISISDLRIGKYKLIETKTNKWYNLAEDTVIEINHDELTNTFIENELKKGQVKVIKIDKDNNEIRLEGVTFEVLDKQGNVLETITTDKNGEAITKEYPIRDYEEIKIHEISTDKWYVLNDEIQTIKLEENKLQTVEFQNEKKKGQIKIIKVDKDNNEIRLEGVVFDVLDEKQNVVDTIVTNEKGEAITKRLPIDQNYTLVERQTKEGYVLSNQIQTVVLRQDEIKEIIFQNEKQKGQIKILKLDAENKEIKLEGVEFKVIDANNNVVETIVTNQDGYAISSKLPIGTYTIKETKTNKDYQLNEEIFKVDVKTDAISELEITNVKIKKLPKTGF